MQDVTQTPTQDYTTMTPASRQAFNKARNLAKASAFAKARGTSGGTGPARTQ